MTETMRIAHFTNTYKPNINGVARSVSTFRQGLSRLGHHVFVFAQEAPHDYEETEPYIFRYPGVNVPQFNYSVTVPSSRTFNKVLPILKPHVIHSNHPIALGDVAAGRDVVCGRMGRRTALGAIVQDQTPRDASPDGR